MCKGWRVPVQYTGCEVCYAAGCASSSGGVDAHLACWRHTRRGLPAVQGAAFMRRQYGGKQKKPGIL